MGGLKQAIDDIVGFELSNGYELVKTEAGPVEGVIAPTLYGIRDRTNLTLQRGPAIVISAGYAMADWRRGNLRPIARQLEKPIRRLSRRPIIHPTIDCAVRMNGG